MGIFLAAIAVAAWGIGDFLIQRSARKVGDWEALFFITAFAAVILLPFIWTSLRDLTSFDWALLVLTSIVILVAALLDFDALRVGKISVIEPIFAMEVPITILLAAIVVGERLSLLQISLIAILLIGIYLVSSKHARARRIRWEKGVGFAILATIGMGAANFLYGFSSRGVGPLMINWFTGLVMAVATLAYLLFRSKGSDLIASWRENKLLVTSMAVSDNIAWLSYSASALFIPIGLATGITESYIALAAILGLLFNKEKLVRHQKLGLAISVFAVILLAIVSKE